VGVAAAVILLVSLPRRPVEHSEPEPVETADLPA
jgi:hypothetical protein